MRSLVQAAIGAEPPLIYVKRLEKRRWLQQILDDDDYLLIETIDADYNDIARLTEGAVHLMLQMLRSIWSVFLGGPLGTSKHSNSIYYVINYVINFRFHLAFNASAREVV